MRCPARPWARYMIPECGPTSPPRCPIRSLSFGRQPSGAQAPTTAAGPGAMTWPARPRSDSDRYRAARPARGDRACVHGARGTRINRTGRNARTAPRYRASVAEPRATAEPNRRSRGRRATHPAGPGRRRARVDKGARSRPGRSSAVSSCDATRSHTAHPTSASLTVHTSHGVLGDGVRRREPVEQPGINPIDGEGLDHHGPQPGCRFAGSRRRRPPGRLSPFLPTGCPSLAHRCAVGPEHPDPTASGIR